MEIDITGQIYVDSEGRRAILNFTRYYVSNQIEKIKVYGKEREILLQSDRPFLRANNKRKATNWKVISQLSEIPGVVDHGAFLSEMFNQLDYVLDKIDFPSSPWEHPKNAK